LSVNVDDLLEKDHLEVSEIMRRIREYLASHGAGEKASAPLGLDLYGSDNNLTEDLAEARRMAGMAYVTLQVRHSNVPILGRFIDLVRNQLHQLVIFYVNRQATAQIAFNVQIVQTLEHLVQAHESESDGKSEPKRQ
jgi:hypothetical protein